MKTLIVLVWFFVSVAVVSAVGTNTVVTNAVSASTNQSVYPQAKLDPEIPAKVKIVGEEGIDRWLAKSDFQQEKFGRGNDSWGRDTFSIPIKEYFLPFYDRPISIDLGITCDYPLSNGRGSSGGGWTGLIYPISIKF